MIALAAAFLHKGEEFGSFIKMGRTQLQDAVPMTLGQEFNAFAHTMLEDVDRLGEAQALIREINMGATAIGTGINAPPGYAESVRRHLEHITGLPLITAPDLVEATADTGAFVQLSGRSQALRGEAVQDLQRSPAAQLRSARGPGRDQSVRRCSPAPRSCRAR